jgi:hypothetical protein
MGIEEARIGVFQAALGTEARGSQWAAAVGTSEKKDVRELLRNRLQETLAFPRARANSA